MTNRAGGRYSWRRRHARAAPAMSRFRGCVMVLAAALGGAAAAVSVAEPRAASPADGTLAAIVGATVVHPELEGAAASSSDSTVIIAGNRIRAVGPAATTSVPRGTRVIDGHGRWVIPGLIDSHVHFFQSGNLYTRPDAADLDRKSTRLNSSHRQISYAVFCLKKKNKNTISIAPNYSHIRLNAITLS